MVRRRKVRWGHHVHGNSTWQGMEVGECNLFFAKKKEAHGLMRVIQDPAPVFSLMFPGVGLASCPSCPFGWDIKTL